MVVCRKEKQQCTCWPCAQCSCMVVSRRPSLHVPVVNKTQHQETQKESYNNSNDKEQQQNKSNNVKFNSMFEFCALYETDVPSTALWLSLLSTVMPNSAILSKSIFLRSDWWSYCECLYVYWATRNLLLVLFQPTTTTKRSITTTTTDNSHKLICYNVATPQPTKPH